MNERYFTMLMKENLPLKIFPVEPVKFDFVPYQLAEKHITHFM